jgi:hypothetical protein
MGLTIYGHPRSACTRRVLVVCKELDIPYVIVPVNLPRGEQRTSEHLARHLLVLFQLSTYVPHTFVPIHALCSRRNVLIFLWES